MANKEIKSFKRTSRPMIMTEEHKKALNGRDITSKIIKYGIIGLIFLTLMFSMLPLVSLEVSNSALDSITGEKSADFSFYDLIGAWFEKSTYDYADRGINSGYVYPHAIDYLIGKVEALQKVANMGLGSQIFDLITEEQDKMLDGAYIAMLIFEIVSIAWLVAMAVLFALSFVKKIRITQTMLNASVGVQCFLTVVMWIMTLALSANGTEDFMFSVGLGMWLNLLISVIMVGFVICNAVYAAKVKACEKK